jgi:hypothetical protein
VFDISAHGGPTAWTISSEKGPLGNGVRFPHQMIYGIAKELGIIFSMLYIF